MLSLHANAEDTITEVLSDVESDLSFNRHKASTFLCKMKVKMTNEKAWYSHSTNCVGADPLQKSDNEFATL